MKKEHAPVMANLPQDIYLMTISGGIKEKNI